MARSAVRSGKFDARDRATKRRRDKSHRPAAQPAPNDQLLDWLKERHAPQLRAMSLDAYLTATGHIELSPGERLRQLAIEIEQEMAANSSWGELKRIYDLALRFDPEYARLHTSMGISCGVFAEHAEWDKKTALQERLTKEAEGYFRHARELDAKDAHVRHAHGYLLMCAGRQDEALALFDEAIALDPTHGWAHLYRAHCLHDLKRWPEAVAAYEAVPREAFKGPVSWRMDLLVQQQAFCSLRAGDTTAARQGFETILTRYEAQPHLAYWSDIWCVHAGAEAFPDLKPRVDALAETLKHLPFPG
ncbi:MAG: tetratricopeptide repeat protein [Polyangiales bacterium]